MMRSLYNIDLSMSEDPFKSQMSPSTTFRVSGIDSNTTTRDIVKCLSNVVDPSIRVSTSTTDPTSVSNPSSTSGKVLYELIWVHDTAFLVSARLPDQVSFSSSDMLKCLLMSQDDLGQLAEIPKLMEVETILQRHADLILDALKKRFATQQISTMEFHLKQQGVKKRLEPEEKEAEPILNTTHGLWGGLWQGLRTVITGFTPDDSATSRKRKRLEETAVKQVA